MQAKRAPVLGARRSTRHPVKSRVQPRRALSTGLANIAAPGKPVVSAAIFEYVGAADAERGCRCWTKAACCIVLREGRQTLQSADPVLSTIIHFLTVCLGNERGHWSCACSTTGSGRPESIRASNSSPQSGHWYFAPRNRPVVNAYSRLSPVLRSIKRQMPAFECTAAFAITSAADRTSVIRAVRTASEVVDETRVRVVSSHPTNHHWLSLPMQLRFSIIGGVKCCQTPRTVLIPLPSQKRIIHCTRARSCLSRPRRRATPARVVPLQGE